MKFFIRPAGPADAEDIADVQRISWRATYAAQLAAASLDRVDRAWGAPHWRWSLERVDDRLIPLVVDGEGSGVVGFGVAGPRRSPLESPFDRYQAEIYLLYLLPSVQRQGLGTALLAAMARVLRARDMNSALVWALSTNINALAFYRRLGAEPLLECKKPFFGETITETALGWNDVEALIHARDLRR